MKYPEPFEELWKICPGKGSKKKSYPLYAKAVPDQVSQATIVAARQAHVDGADEPRFVKHLERWIQDRRWEGQDIQPEDEHLWG